MLLAGSLAAQRSELALELAPEDELVFARELAVRYRYVDLAESVLGALSKESLSDEQKATLALVHCQVDTEGAKCAGDPHRRLELFAKAAASFRDFFAAHPSSELRCEAERSHLDLISHYGRALELALEESVLMGTRAGEATRLRETIQRVLGEGLERTAALETATPVQISRAEELETWRLILDRAQMRITRGQVTPDPEPDFRLAQLELERVVGAAGEASGPGLNAALLLAKLACARGHHDDAVRLAEFVVTTAVPENHLNADWKELAPETKAERFKLVELALPDLLASLGAGGRTARACAWSLFFTNTWRREGFILSPSGSLALLSVARVLHAAGGHTGGSMTQGNSRWFATEAELGKAGFAAQDSLSALELALATAQDVRTENTGNLLALRAQRVISDILGRPGQPLPPDALFEAALSEYEARAFETASAALEQLIRALDERDDATRRASMPKVLYYLGLSYAELMRPLEAAEAFRTGATTWKGDPEYQPKLAQGFYREIDKLRRGGSGDEFIEQQFLLGESLVKESDSGTGADVIRWREAERAYGRADYAAARMGYLTVGALADLHEKALVKAGLCLYKLNDTDGARRELERYLEVFVPDPVNAIDAGKGVRKLAARQEARAQATYYLGKLAFDAQAWDEVLAILYEYEKRFAAQPQYAASALDLVLQAHIAKGDLAAAHTLAATLRAHFPDDASTGQAAFALYKALKTEQEAADKAGDKARSRALKREMVQSVRVSNQTACAASYPALRVESTLWLELGEWALAEETLRTTLQTFEGQADKAADLDRFVRPDLGEALLQQMRVAEAFAVLDPLVPKEASAARMPAPAVVRNWCRAVTGWVAGDGAQYLEVPGVGGDLARVSELLEELVDAKQAAYEAWSCPWYELKLAQAFTFLQGSRADARQRADAERMLDEVLGQLGDPELGDVGKKCGDDLRQRFLWLRSQLR